MGPVMTPARRHQTGIVAIAAFKLVKGGLLLVVGFALVLETLHINADTRFVHALVLKVDALQPHSILIAGLVSLGYAALLLAEGIGLWMEVSWAAYLTVVSTSALIPFEIYELIERTTVPRIVLLAVNLMIVVYLIKQLKQHRLGGRYRKSRWPIGAGG